MRATINARLLASSAVQAGYKPFLISDTKLTGFCLRVQPSGVKSYILRLGPNRTITIGKADRYKPDEARSRAETMLANVTKGRPLMEGLDGPSDALTLGQFIEATYAPWVVEHRKDAAATLKRLENVFGRWYGKPIADIDAESVERWKLARLKDKRAPSTVLRDLASISGVLTRAARAGVLKENPISSVYKPKVDRRPKVRYLSPEEESRLRDALAKRDAKAIKERESSNEWRAERQYQAKPTLLHFADHLTPAVLLSMNTGLRRGELLALTWADVDLKNRVITVEGKGSKSGHTRHVPLNNEAVDLFTKWREQTAADEGRVFPVEYVRTAFVALLKAADIERFRWHDLRHHFASRLAQRGVALNTIRELLGHGDLTMTLRYAHLSPNETRAAVEVLG